MEMLLMFMLCGNRSAADVRLSAHHTRVAELQRTEVVGEAVVGASMRWNGRLKRDVNTTSSGNVGIHGPVYTIQ